MEGVVVLIRVGTEECRYASSACAVYLRGVGNFPGSHSWECKSQNTNKTSAYWGLRGYPVPLPLSPTCFPCVPWRPELIWQENRHP